MKSSAAAPRFLVTRLGTVGDVILTLPVACALRDHFPESRITWVVEESSSSVVKGHRAVDAVVEMERDWSKSLSGIREARSRLQSHEIEIAIDCQGNSKSALAGWLSGASRRLGYSRRSAGGLRRFFYNERVTPVFSHLTDRSLELLTLLGIHTPQVQWDFPISQAARTWAERWYQSLATHKLAIMTPSGTWKSKCWEADRFASAARYMHDRYGYRTAVAWETYEDRLLAEDIVTRSASAAVLAPNINLIHLAALLEKADLFIGGDCSTLHLAVAVGTRSIGLYGATRPVDTGPYGQVALQRAYEMGSLRHRRRADNTAMKTIGVEHVCQVVDEFEASTETVCRMVA